MHLSSSQDEIQIGITRPKLAEVLLSTTYAPVFPFLSLRFESGESSAGPMTIRVEPKLFELLTSIYGKDTFLEYLDMRNGRVEPWTKEMIVTLRLMEKLGLVSKIEEWLREARRTMLGLLSAEKMSIDRKRDTEAFVTSKLILQAADALRDIESNTTLTRVAEDAVKSSDRDRDTLIYRMAMAIYHSKRLSGEAAVQAIEDPGLMYLALVGKTDQSKELAVLGDEFQSYPLETRPELVRVFICFVASCYLYERSVKA